MRADPRTSADWRARPLWDIVGRLGLQVGVVRWPVTFPAQPVRGVLVADRFHTVADSPIPSELEEVVYPPDFIPLARAAFADVTPGPSREIVPPRGDRDAVLVEESGGSSAERLDRAYGRVADEARRVAGVRLLALRYQGLDTVGRSYLRYAEPGHFGDVSESERLQYGQVLNQYYAFIDGEIGRCRSAANQSSCRST